MPSHGPDTPWQRREGPWQPNIHRRDSSVVPTRHLPAPHSALHMTEKPEGVMSEFLAAVLAKVAILALEALLVRVVHALIPAPAPAAA